MNDVVIVSAVRTPMGSFMGSLSSVSATDLGATAVKGALEKINLKPNLVDEVFFGNVLQAGLGQAPARQVAIKAGIADNVPCTTINKVCASGSKSIIIGAQSIKCGDNDIVVVGGTENMSQVPSYLKTARTGQKLGNQTLVDGLVYDGLTDVYNNQHMGVCAEECASKYSISREEQDEFAINSYKKSAKAWEDGKFNEEVIPVSVPQRKGEPIIVSEDEEYKNVNFDKVSKLPTVFKKDGTITPANASTLNDGASALILMSAKKAEELNIKPLARIVSYADAAHEPMFFTTAPSLSLPKAVEKAGLTLDDIDYFELNEAFSVVGLANMKILDLNPEKVNVNGGAVSLGHPLGSSGSRILVTLINVLKQNNGKYGAIGICNGGGGASSIIIENL
ncbi:MAG: acetyl-CoA C-acyltransferase [Flavobacteriales bacterium]|nr:acetyl-CoA C-acyltransferase [Flavobacteriales bacterium]